MEEIALFAPHFQLRIRSDILKKEKRKKELYADWSLNGGGLSFEGF